MKVLLIVATALVLAQGSVLPVNDELQPKERSMNVVYAEEPQMAYEAEVSAVEGFLAEAGAYDPITARACTHARCQSICRSRGWRYGRCINSTTCLCFN